MATRLVINIKPYDLGIIKIKSKHTHMTLQKSKNLNNSIQKKSIVLNKYIESH